MKAAAAIQEPLNLSGDVLGLLAWRILVRDDGALPGQGRLPVLIQWQGRHPTEVMPISAVALQAVAFGAVPPREATVLRLRGARVVPGGPALVVRLATPLGSVCLQTPPQPELPTP